MTLGRTLRMTPGQERQSFGGSEHCCTRNGVHSCASVVNALPTPAGTAVQTYNSRMETAKPPPGARYIFSDDFEVTFFVEIVYASAFVL